MILVRVSVSEVFVVHSGILLGVFVSETVQRNQVKDQVGIRAKELPVTGTVDRNAA